MLILRDRRNQRVVFGKERPLHLLCRNRRAAEQAVDEIHKRTGTVLDYERVDRTRTTGLWLLRRRNGKIHNKCSGVTFAFQSEWDAWQHAGTIFNETGKILIPTPV